jgi:hypothetical protein
MAKEIRPEYLFWRKRVEGQIRHTINDHPEWFNLPDDEAYGRCVRGMAKRIIGEIVAVTASGDSMRRHETGLVCCAKNDGAQVPSASSLAVCGIPTADRQLNQQSI